MPTLLEQIADFEQRLNAVEAVVGTAKLKKVIAITSAFPPAPPHGMRHKELVLRVLSDGIPKSVSKITAQASQFANRKQKKSSVNVMCSQLYHAGDILRVDKGIYQKKA